MVPHSSISGGCLGGTLFVQQCAASPTVCNMVRAPFVLYLWAETGIGRHAHGLGLHERAAPHPRPCPHKEPDVHVKVDDFRHGEASGRAGGDGQSMRDPGAPLCLTLYSAAFHRADHLFERASTVYIDLQFPSNHAGYKRNRRHPVAKKRLTKQRNGLAVWGPFEIFVLYHAACRLRAKQAPQDPLQNGMQ